MGRDSDGLFSMGLELANLWQRHMRGLEQKRSASKNTRQHLCDVHVLPWKQTLPLQTAHTLIVWTKSSKVSTRWHRPTKRLIEFVVPVGTSARVTCCCRRRGAATCFATIISDGLSSLVRREADKHGGQAPIAGSHSLSVLLFTTVTSFSH